MKLFVEIVFLVAVFSGALALLVSFISRAGPIGGSIADQLIKAPMLDVMLGLFSWIPWLVLGPVLGARGVIACVIGQILALQIWIVGHEYVHREAVAGPRIVKVLNRTIGRWQNHAALWVTSVAFPGFLFIRLMEVAMYPFLVLLLKFPKYKQAEWINISRQKFTGLVGHDLIWCLYCDWMTGVYSLGAEMLRNVESFWCPIRFYDGKKCDNCKLDFPDVDGGWVAADAGMKQVVDKLEVMYGSDRTLPGDNAWFGHPVRLTVKGK